MTAPVRKYNPAFLTDAELVASFCVRTGEFASIVEALRESTGASNVHRIVIGPRGSGKTSLLLRVAAEIRGEESLSHRLLPVVFAEESYGVATVGEFWLECLRRVADQVPSIEGELDLQRTVEELRTIQDDKALEDRCLGAIQDVADSTAKRLVLIVENLNMMFRDMPDANTAAWRLRHTLQTDPRIVLLASATSRFDQIDHPDRALYDLFRTLQLRPLNTEECATLWEAVSGQCREPGIIRSLEILTGGSPRLLAIVARFGGGLSFQDLMAQLLDLVDDHTEYFKSHLESLPAQERRVYLALAELWKPASTREIAEQARLDTNRCSAQLKRLVERGAVIVAGGSARRKLHYLAERLYNIYYLLRTGRGPDRLLEALVRFMASYYSPRELKDVGARLVADISNVSDELAPLYRGALTKLLALPELGEYRTELLARVPNDLVKAVTPSDVAEAEEMLADATEHQGQGRIGEALNAYGELVNRYGAVDELSLKVGFALVQRGRLLEGLGRFEEALVTYDEAVDRLDHSAVSAGGLSDSGLVAFALTGKVSTLYELDRTDETLTVSGELTQRFADSEDLPVVSVVATSLVVAGHCLQKASRMEEALTTFDEVVSRFGEVPVPEVKQAVGLALLEKAYLEMELRRFGCAAETGTQAIHAYHSMAPREEVLVAHSMRALARLLDGIGESVYDGDIQAMLELLSQFDSTPSIVIEVLILASIRLGAATVRDWILTSPAADRLLPLTTALAQELGLETRVAQEVDEVAQDIRREISESREAIE